MARQLRQASRWTDGLSVRYCVMKDSLLARALRILLVGHPRIPAQPSSDYPSSLSRLLAVMLFGLQLIIYLVAAAGGITLWVLAKWHNWDDPLKGSWIGSIAFEGWALFGPVLGIAILHTSRRWAVPTGVEWGWMAMRLGLLIFLVLFGSYLVGGLEHDISVSLITSLCLIVTARFYWRLGTKTIYATKTLTPEHFKIRQRRLLQGENLIFLSYRREDSQAWTDRIADELKERFGKKAVFQDVEAIPPGDDYREHLQTQLQHCLVFLVVIGPDWVTVKDEHGHRRLDQDRDCVRYEIELALLRKTTVIPLLVDGAVMPTKKELPDSIEALAFKNGLPIRANPDFEHDFNRLIRAVEPLVVDRSLFVAYKEIRSSETARNNS